MRNNLKKIVSDLIFYGILISLVAASIVISGRNGAGPRMLGPYSAFTVLTGSMEKVIPKDSLVVTKMTDPLELQVGDDITYMVSETTTVTHRIIKIEENYLNTGERAFHTQGVMNKDPDRNPVMAVNVVGKVIYHNKLLGTLVTFGKENWPLIIFLIITFLVFLKTIDYIIRKGDEKEPIEATVKDDIKEELEILDLSEENFQTANQVVQKEVELEIVEL